MSGLPNFIAGSDIRLICWLDWYDGPVSGLARWAEGLVWFRLNSDVGEDTRTYEVFCLTPEQVVECLDWFEEKRDWFRTRAPQIRKIRREVADKTEQQRLIGEQGLSLREWDGPEISSNVVAWFADDQMGADWFDSDRWCPVVDDRGQA